MAQVVLPQQPFSGMDIAMGPDKPGNHYDMTDISSRRDSSPNDTFVFPEQANFDSAKASHEDNSSSAADRRSTNDTFKFPEQSHPDSVTASHERSSSSTTYRRNQNRQRPSNLSISALPPFDFGFPAKSPTNVISSPSRSPARLTPPILHPSGHKRSGSEFIGGDLTQGGPVLISTSPTTNEELPQAPPSPQKGPPTGRRGHAHRRSGAVSQSDVKMIMQPASEHRGGSSAPSTPSEPTFRPARPPGPGRSNSQPGSTKGAEIKPGTPADRPNSESGQSRSRVGFSEVLEFIPRPLSTISSETSSSMSTIRASHSVTDSISSVVSGQATSSPSTKATSPSEIDGYNEDLLPKRQFSPRSSRNIVEEPRSAEVIDTLSERLWLSQKEDGRTQPYVSSVDTLEPATQGHRMESDRASLQQRAYSNPSFDRSLRPWTNQPRPTSLQSGELERPRTSPEPKVSKRQHKVKSWAGSILHRKDRQPPGDNESFMRSFQTPPLDMPPDSGFSLEDVTFDDDTTHIIEEPAAHPPVPSTIHMNPFPNRLEEPTSTSNVESSSPMIDIDAALGSLGSPSHDAAYDDYFGRFSNTKRRLHSSGETGGFTGPGMHYHRRAESVPSMPSFDHTRCGIPRLGSNNAMNEAIEEEEEDTDQDATQRDQQVSGLGVNIVESDIGNNAPIRRRRSDHSAAEDKQQGINGGSTLLNTSAIDPVEIADAEEEPRLSVITKSSDETTITPTLSQDPLSPELASAPLDSALETPSLTYGTTPETPSAVSSAEYSKTSFDVRDLPRTHTANSSITDRVTLNSSKVGDYGSGSMDDVPSLTSSASTMFSGHATRFSSSGNTTASAERSASLTATMPATIRPGSSSKRSSLISLTRLVGGSYNRSRLNIEETLPPDSPEKPDKKKRRRLSRMMHFWKSKEKLSTT